MSESSKTEDKIKEAFVEQMNRTSFQKVSMSGLAKDLGISRTHLYNHYSSKEELFIDIIQDRLEMFFNLVEEIRLDEDKSKWNVIIQKLIAVLQGSGDVFLEIDQADDSNILFGRFKGLISRSLGHVARTNDIEIKDRDYFEVLCMHLASSAYHVTKAWSRCEKQVRPEKITLLYADIFNEGILEKLKLCEET